MKPILEILIDPKTMDYTSGYKFGKWKHLVPIELFELILNIITVI